MSVFSKIKPSDLVEYLTLCKKYRPSFDVENATQIALASIKYYRGNEALREVLREGHALEKRWYDSLQKGKPDYSVYDDDYFISDVWSCWVLYSRKYLLAMTSPKALSTGQTPVSFISARSVIDLGCGFGYTTAALKELFPKANVFATNIEGTLQFKVAFEVGKRAGFIVRPNIAAVGAQTDLVFASEYFEHIEDPIAHLEEILRVGRPRFLLLANAFGATAVGHFDVYKHGVQLVPGKQMGRLFNKTLRAHGYEQVKTNFWNNRPAFWAKKA